MGRQTTIEWTHHTFNPWWECTKVSPGCQHCYAETWAKRVGQAVWGKRSPRRFFGDAHWARTDRMANVFELRTDLNEPRSRLWILISETTCLDWLLLTENTVGDDMK